MTGHVFVTYSALDATSPYVRQLVGYLSRASLPVHAHQESGADELTPASSQLIDACGVVVVVVTPSAVSSGRVRAEVEHARSQGKPLMPILLAGSPPGWLSGVAHLDVRDGQLPGREFVERLRWLASGDPIAPAARSAPGAGSPPAPRPRRRLLVGLLVGGAILAVISAGVSYLVVRSATQGTIPGLTTSRASDAQVGTCLAGTNPSELKADKVTVVPCTSTQATFRVVQRIDNLVYAQSQNACTDPATKFVFWTGRSGQTGTTLCLAAAR